MTVGHGRKPVSPKVIAITRADGTGEAPIDGNARTVSGEAADELRARITKIIVEVAGKLGPGEGHHLRSRRGVATHRPPRWAGGRGHVRSTAVQENALERTGIGTGSAGPAAGTTPSTLLVWADPWRRALPGRVRPSPPSVLPAAVEGAERGLEVVYQGVRTGVFGQKSPF